MPSEDVEEHRQFRDYFVARRDMVRRTAYILCGDWHWADDLTQNAFMCLAVNCRKVNDRQALAAAAALTAVAVVAALVAALVVALVVAVAGIDVLRSSDDNRVAEDPRPIPTAAETPPWLRDGAVVTAVATDADHLYAVTTVCRPSEACSYRLIGSDDARATWSVRQSAFGDGPNREVTAPAAGVLYRTVQRDNPGYVPADPDSPEMIAQRKISTDGGRNWTEVRATTTPVDAIPAGGWLECEQEQDGPCASLLAVDPATAIGAAGHPSRDPGHRDRKGATGGRLLAQVLGRGTEGAGRRHQRRPRPHLGDADLRGERDTVQCGWRQRLRPVRWHRPGRVRRFHRWSRRTGSTARPTRERPGSA